MVNSTLTGGSWDSIGATWQFRTRVYGVLCDKEEVLVIKYLLLRSTQTKAYINVIAFLNPFHSPRLSNSNACRYTIGNFLDAVLTTPINLTPSRISSFAVETEPKCESAQTTLCVWYHGSINSFRTLQPWMRSSPVPDSFPSSALTSSWMFFTSLSHRAA